MSNLEDSRNAPMAAATDPQERSRRLADGFRSLLEATARPALARRCPSIAWRPEAIGPAAAAAIEILVDDAAPLWIPPRLRAAPGFERSLRFATGSAPAERPEDAAFLLGRWPELAAMLDRVRLGTPERPDLSATLLIETGGLSEDPFDGAQGARFTGPGVAPDAPRTLWIAGVDARFWAQLDRGAAGFPIGLDFLLFDQDRLAAAPRSVAATRL